MPQQFREIKRGLYRLLGTDRAGYKCLRRARKALEVNLWREYWHAGDGEAVQLAVQICDQRITHLNMPAGAAGD